MQGFRCVFFLSVITIAVVVAVRLDDDVLQEPAAQEEQPLQPPQPESDPCACSDSWQYESHGKRKTYRGCAMAADEDYTWCLVVGGPNCTTASPLQSGSQSWRKCDPLKCEDDEEVAHMCKTWALDGGCVSNMAYMHVACIKTCGMCKGDKIRNTFEKHKLQKLESDLQLAWKTRENEYEAFNAARIDAMTLKERHARAKVKTQECQEMVDRVTSAVKASAVNVPALENASMDASKLAEKLAKEETKARIEDKIASGDVRRASVYENLTSEGINELRKQLGAAQEEELLRASEFQTTDRKRKEEQDMLDQIHIEKTAADARVEEKATIEQGLAKEAQQAKEVAEKAEMAFNQIMP